MPQLITMLILFAIATVLCEIAHSLDEDNYDP